MNVLVSVPNTGWIHKHVSIALLRIAADKRHRVRVIHPTHTPVEVNYNMIAKDFYEGDFQFWLNIDSDNPPVSNPLDLIELDKDIIGLPTPVFHNDVKNKPPGEKPFYMNAYQYVPEKKAYTEWKDRSGLQKVDAIGSGSMLVHRRVFANRNMRVRPFELLTNEDGSIALGSDLSFSKKAQDNGFEVYAHFDYLCLHFNEIELQEAITAFVGMKI
jgi:hypothetical protein